MREGAAIIDPEEDYMTIAAAEETMSHTEAARRKELDQAKSKLKGTPKYTLASISLIGSPLR